jgi:AcrR family transcriptional regulator
LERGAFETTSIADVAAEAGCSVGAFYQRFADKEAFFAVVIQSVLAEIVADAKRTTTEPAFAEGAIEDVLKNCVVHWVETFRRYRGLIRTMMKKALHTEDTWTPLRETGVAAVESFIVLLAVKSRQVGIASFRYRALAGFQIVTGVLVNASLHRTALLNLDSDELVAWTYEILRHCLFDELPPMLLEQGPIKAPGSIVERTSISGRRLIHDH